MRNAVIRLVLQPSPDSDPDPVWCLAAGHRPRLQPLNPGMCESLRPGILAEL
jgi:hypothetical protein